MFQLKTRNSDLRLTMSRHVFLVRITEKNGMIFATPSSIIYNLRRDRFEQLTKALRKKHDTAFSIFELAKLALLSAPIVAEIYTRIDNITGKYEVSA